MERKLCASLVTPAVRAFPSIIYPTIIYTAGNTISCSAMPIGKTSSVTYIAEKREKTRR